MPYGSSAKCCIIGKANAKVFPEPVLAAPMQSSPASIRGIHPFWIGVGVLIPKNKMKKFINNRNNIKKYSST